MNARQKAKLTEAIIAVGVDPDKISGGQTAFEFIAWRIKRHYAGDPQALNVLVPGYSVLVEKVFTKLDKRYFTTRSGRSNVAQDEKAVSFTVTLGGNVKKSVLAEAAKTGKTTGSILQKIVYAYFEGMPNVDDKH